MLNIKSLLLLSLMGFSALASAQATEQVKFGYVNTQRIFRDAPAAVKAAKKLEAEFSKRDQDLQRMAKQLQSMQEGLEKNSVTMSETERRSKEREFGEMSREFQRKQREFREDLNLRQNEENSALIEKASKAIKQIAESEKYDVILQDVFCINPKQDICVSPKLDITEKVIKALTESK